jgi:hypothetical protein
MTSRRCSDEDVAIRVGERRSHPSEMRCGRLSHESAEGGARDRRGGISYYESDPVGSCDAPADLVGIVLVSTGS